MKKDVLRGKQQCSISGLLWIDPNPEPGQPVFDNARW